MSSSQTLSRIWIGEGQAANGHFSLLNVGYIWKNVNYSASTIMTYDCREQKEKVRDSKRREGKAYSMWLPKKSSQMCLAKLLCGPLSGQAGGEGISLQFTISSLFLCLYFLWNNSNKFFCYSSWRSPKFSPSKYCDGDGTSSTCFLTASVRLAPKNASSLGLASGPVSFCRGSERFSALLVLHLELFWPHQGCEKCDLVLCSSLFGNLHYKFYLLSYWLSFMTDIHI